MTKATPTPGNDTGLSDAQRRAPITEEDLMTLNGLALAIELCSDVIDGLIDPGTAKRALPTLVRLHRDALDQILTHAHEAQKGGAA